MRLSAIIFCFTLGCANARAEVPTQLFFPVEKSNIQILPQRFEYQLLNKDQIRIGNITIDATEIDFQILPLNKKNLYKLQFRWPAGLLDQGEIAIKDNGGKGIWFQKIPAGKVTLSEDKTIASFETETEVPSLLKLIQLYPFFRFCVHREETLNKTYLCSKDLYLRKSADKIVIEKKDSYRPQSFIEINGRPVGDQGMIFLNSPNEFVSLRALLLSGANLEIDTRMRKIDFKDVYLSPDEKQIIVRAQGAEPVDPASVEHLADMNDNEWQTRLDAERPFTYLKGEGDLPLRLEFLIQGPVRKEDVKVSVLDGAAQTTFKDEHEMLIKPASGMKLSQADRRTKIDLVGNGSYKWTLTQLKKNESNRRYVRVSSGANDFFAAYELERSSAFDASLRLMLPLWAQAQLLFTPTNHWGVQLQLDSQWQKSESELNTSLFTGGLQYRFTSAAHGHANALATEVYAQSLKAETSHFLLYGFGLQAELKSPDQWSRWFQWTYLKFRYPLGLTDSSSTLQSSSFEAELSLRSYITPVLYWELGARSHSYKFEKDQTEIESEKSMGFVGGGFIF